jgi:hypothetical protein
MKKKLASLALAIVLVIGSSVTVFADFDGDRPTMDDPRSTSCDFDSDRPI